MLNYMRFWLQANLGQRERGATLIEYVLIVAVIAIAVFAAAQTGLVTAIQGVFTSAENCIGGTCS